LHILVFRREEKLTGAFWTIGRVNHVSVPIISLSSAKLEQDGHAYCAPRCKALCALPVFTARKKRVSLWTPVFTGRVSDPCCPRRFASRK